MKQKSNLLIAFLFAIILGCSHDSEQTNNPNTIIEHVSVGFPESTLVTDCFHVVKLVTESLQHERIQLRWKELDKEKTKP